MGDMGVYWRVKEGPGEGQRGLGEVGEGKADIEGKVRISSSKLANQKSPLPLGAENTLGYIKWR